MKKLSVLLLVLLIAACDEGLTIKIPASDSVSAVMPSSVINAEPNNLFEESKTVDLATLIDEDAQSIQSIKLDKLSYTVSGYDNTSSNGVMMDLTLQTRLGATITDILVVTGLVVANSGEIVAFEDGNPVSALNAAQVASLEAIMDNLQEFDFIIKADFTDDIDSDFTVEVSWDITASVSVGDE